MSSAWFEISNDGWRRIHASRPLGSLLCEALQNALDEDVTRVSVTLTADGVTVEDDGARGFAMNGWSTPSSSRARRNPRPRVAGRGAASKS